MFRGIELYKELHKIPELGFNEVKTKSLIKEFLFYYNISFKESHGGIVAQIKVNNNKNYIGFRCEIDGLEITEKTNCGFESIHEGFMHACGHDLHTAVILESIAKISQNKNKLKENVKFIFQSAEENGQGSKELISSGLINDVSKIYGFHNSNIIDKGMIGLQKGPINSYIYDFEVEVFGKSAHVAQPYLGKDALNGTINFINNIKLNQSSNFGAHKQYLISFSNVSTNNALNVICDYLRFNGTIRIGSNDIKDNVITFFNQCLENTMKSQNLDYKIKSYDLIQLVNNENIHEELKTTFAQNYVELKNMSSGGDDFSNYLTICDGYLIKLGSKWEDKINYPVHNEFFLPNYNCIDFGSDMILKILNMV